MSKKFIFVNTDGDYEESPGAFEVSDHINSSSGVGDAAKPIVTGSDGKIDSSLIPFEGLTWKAPARVATTADITLATAPASIDGVTLSNGDRVLVKNQTDQTENGIYVFNGAGSAMTRAEDLDENDELVASVVIAVEEGTTHADQAWMITSDNPLTIGLSNVEFGLLPFNTFSGGDGIDLTNYVFSVDLLDSGSGLYFAGGGTDELAIEFATDFTIDAADDLAMKASDIASTANGEGASIVGVEDASAYYAGDNLEAILDELEAQLGGDSSSTFDFSENNVLADNDAVYAALEKLDLKWGDLASQANGEGASLVGIEDAAGNFTATDVEGALAEVYALASIEYDRELATADGALAKGDLVYISGSGTVAKLNIANANYGVGLALDSAADTEAVQISASDELVVGVLVGAVPGTKYYWDGSSLTTTIPSASGSYVWQVGYAFSATDLWIDVEFVKKNA